MRAHTILTWMQNLMAYPQNFYSTFLGKSRYWKNSTGTLTIRKCSVIRGGSLFEGNRTATFTETFCQHGPSFRKTTSKFFQRNIAVWTDRPPHSHKLKIAFIGLFVLRTIKCAKLNFEFFVELYSNISIGIYKHGRDYENEIDKNFCEQLCFPETCNKLFVPVYCSSIGLRSKRYSW